jgi:hypothetical protein
VNAVKREHNHHEEIRGQEQPVKPVPTIESTEGRVSVMGLEIVGDAMRRADDRGKQIHRARRKQVHRMMCLCESRFEQGSASAGESRNTSVY